MQSQTIIHNKTKKQNKMIGLSIKNIDLIYEKQAIKKATPTLKRFVRKRRN